MKFHCSVCIGNFVWQCLLNPTTNEYETCTVEHSKDMIPNTLDLHAFEHPCIQYTKKHG